MRTSAVKMTSPNKGLYARSAKHGAVMTSAMFATTTAMAALIQPQAMKDEIVLCGGALKYAAKYAAGLAVLSLGGAVLSAGLAFIFKHTKTNENPKAVN